jgi:hypothetical protein
MQTDNETDNRTKRTTGASRAAQPLDYASPRPKVKKPWPDVAFLMAWMMVFIGLFAVMWVLIVALDNMLFF